MAYLVRDHTCSLREDHSLVNELVKSEGDYRESW